MSTDPQMNKAVRGLQNAIDYCNSLDAPIFEGFEYADEFFYADRRTGGVNFGTLDHSGLEAMLASAWDVGVGRPHFSIRDVVAIRDDLCALVVFSIAYEDGSRSELLHLQQLDRASRLRRIVQFDLDDVEAAAAELDLLSTEE
jgi:hypothetical protein